ncbi:MAG: LPS export ABC transporter periplasmic protein LptC [Proteobacteria bacterium]|nr:LPS export ABC transporter periplasmic protein LptC [Pseudomonadota bacterium]
MRLNIRIIKYIILAAAILLFGILLVYTQPQTDLLPLLNKNDGILKTEKLTEKEKQIVKSLKENSKIDKTAKLVDQTITQSPVFVGEDENSNLWNLEASKAVQAGSVSEGTTDLFNVVAKTISTKNKKVDYIADGGKYIPTENKILLKGNVVLKSEDLQLKTNILEYNLLTGFAETKSRTVITSNTGRLEGDTLKSYDNAERLVLEGKVRAVLYNK